MQFLKLTSNLVDLITNKYKLMKKQSKFIINRLRFANIDSYLSFSIISLTIYSNRPKIKFENP